MLVYQLLLTGFITGILDATTYADYGTFTSNQTGNAVLLGIGIVGIAQIRLVDVATSLSSFLISAIMCGQIAVRIRPGKGRTRWWLIASSFYQAISILVLWGIAQNNIIEIDSQWSWLVLLSLASSSGSQVAMAKQCAVPEIPTAMLTSPFADVATDAYFLSTTFSKPYNVPRNRRMSYILILIVGVFVGAAIHKYRGTKAVLLVAALLKLAVMCSFFAIAREVSDTLPTGQ